MNLNAVKFSLAFGGGLLLVACGDDVTQVTQETSGMEVVSSADSLGKCTEERSGEMKFASKENAVYVCSDSSWKNVSATENVSCSAESFKDSSGFKIVCDGDSVGVIFNGKDGSDGKDGEAGAVESYCTVEESPLLDSDFGRGAYLVVCGSDTVGTIRDGLAGKGCTITDNGDGTVTQVCGGETVTFYKAFCGGKPFDLDSSFCYNNSADSCAKYGRLYTWAAAMDSAAVFGDAGKGCGFDVTCFPAYPVRGICPDGWHLPSVGEWEIKMICGVDRAMDRMRSVLECFLRASATAMGRSLVFFSQRSSGLLRRKTRTT